MECNKDEANRAKNIAEKKMESKDFVGAKKLLLKALQLFPDIENVSHMLTVCEVHCSADSLINGHVDHYGVLQVEHLASETAIRKQYHRLALLLHPDKNKFAGAEAAFKLVGDSYKVLSDKANRQVYDLKTRGQVKAMLSRQSSQHAKGYCGATSNNQFGGTKQQVQHASSTSFASQCFWTMCVFCNYRFQYSRTFLNRELQCQRCFKKFHAFELSPVGMPPPGSTSSFAWSRTDLNHTDVSGQHSKNGSRTSFDIPTTKEQENAVRNSTAKSSKPTTASMHKNNLKNEEDASSCGIGKVSNQGKSVNSEDKPSMKPSSGSTQQRRNKGKVTSSSDSVAAQSNSTDRMTDMGSAEHHDGSTSCGYPRRSTRCRMNAEVHDSDNDDGFECPPKKLRKAGTYDTMKQNMSTYVMTNDRKDKTSETPISGEKTKGDQAGFDPCKDNLHFGNTHARVMMPGSKEASLKKEVKQVKTGRIDTSAVNPKCGSPQVQSSFTYPDPEFYDFEKDRHQTKFAVNQIWAAYDEWDAMPRFYALIKKVYTSAFKLQYTWLEYNPTSAIEKAWYNAGLPIACGNYKTGETHVTCEEMMFSRLISFAKGKGRTYNIYPKKGEIWALFKNWDLSWCSAEAAPKECEYDFVEVVSDFAYGQDITVSCLVKVKGFICLFARVHDKGATVVPSGQLLRFSHCVPYYRVCKHEGIPGDSFELDPAALPLSILQITKTVADTAEVVDVKFHDPCSNPEIDKVKLCSVDKNKGWNRNHNDEEASNKRTSSGLCQNTDKKWSNTGQAGANQHVDSEAHHGALSTRGEAMTHSGNDEYGLTEFHNFQEDRTVEKFKLGQIWALYSDIDEYPNYYGWIKKVKLEGSGVIISVKWLEFLAETDKERLCLKNDLPVSCGRFLVRGGDNHYDSTDAFSHLVHELSIKKNALYEIYPNCGEVWAVLKNWSVNVGWQRAADYGVVQIVERDKCVIKVLPLTKVKGYKYVFMPEASGVTDIQIPIDECLRFSHQIPAFKLTDQESGKLKDYWELDPDSIPKMLLSKA